MADTSGIKAGRAYIELGVGDKLTSGLKLAQARLKAFGAGVRNVGLGVAGLGSLVVAPMLAAVKSFADSGTQLWDMSKRTGIAVEALSELDYMAAQTGSSLEGVERGVRIMQKSIMGAADAAEGTTGKLDHLGLSAADLVGKAPIEQFGLIASRIRAIRDPSLKAAAALAVFGRSGTELIPMLDQFQKLHGEAKDFGIIKSTKSAKQAKDFSDAMTLMGRVIKTAWYAVGSAIIPILQDFAGRITGAAAMVRDWLKANQGLVVSVFQIAAVAVAAGTGLAVLGVAIQKLGLVFGIAAVAIKALVPVLAFLTSPIGAAIVAIGALGAVILAETGAGGKALDWLGGKFATLQSEASDSYQGIADALAAGEIGLAAKVLWTTLKMWWTKGVTWISTIWNDAMLWVKDTFTTAWGGLRSIFSTVGYGLKVAWIETTAFLADTWTGFVNGVLTAWYWVGNKITHAWNWLKSLWDDSFDAEAANAAADQAYEATKKGIDAEAAARKKAIEDQRAAERVAEAKDYDDSLRKIAFETQASRQALQKEHDAKIKAAEAGLDAARKEWQGARGAAKEARQAKEAGAWGPRKTGSDVFGGYNDLWQKIQGASSGLSDAIKTSVTGTFNASALFGMGAGTAADRTAKATEDTAKNTKKLIGYMANGAAVFI